MNGFHRIVLCIVPAFVLSACVRAPIENKIEQTWEARKGELTRIAGWDLRARIAVRAGNDAGSASLHWTQHEDEYRLRVITPFGGGVYELAGGREGAWLRTSEDRVVRAEDAETLLRQHAGWQLPVAGLVYWVRGIPTPTFPVDTLLLDKENRLNALNQAGWSLQYKSYVEVDGQSMPGRLDLRNERIRIRVSIKEWKLH